MTAGPLGRLSQAISRRFLLEWLAVALVCLAAVAALDLSGATRPFDGLVYDGLLQTAERGAPDDILIVGIDDKSLAAIGRWPWPRSVHARLLQTLAKSRPKAVLYDVLFTEPQPGEDGALAAAIAACRSVYLPLLLTVPGLDGAPYAVARPAGAIAAGAAGVGQVNIHPDPDGIVRRAYLTETDGLTSWPHLVAQLDAALHGRPRPPFEPGAALPALEGHEEMLIPYAGPAGRIRSVSFVDVLNGEVPDAFLRGKTLFVGATGVGLGDRFPTPVGGRSSDMAGVEIQANMLDGLERGVVAHPAGRPGQLVFSLLPVAVLLAAFISLRPLLNAALGLGLIVMTLAASALGLAQFHTWLAPGAALAGLALAYPIWGWRRLEAASAYMLEELKRLQAEPGVLDGPGDTLGHGDVVERQLRLMRRQVARVRDLRRFVSDALAGLPDATFVVEADGRVVMRSNTAEGFLASLKLDADESAIAAVFAAVRPVDEGSALTLGAPPAGEVETPGGERYQLGQAPILAHDGAALGWIVRFGDVTEIRQAQDRREEILQLLTHDMRSPQASILALLDAPENRTAPVSRRIRALAERTVALADAYVRLSRAEHGALRLETLDAGDLLVEAADAVWPQARAKGVTMDAEPPPGERLVQADRGMMGRALINLIDNAVKAAPEGSTVTCRVEIRDGMAVFSVQDQGAGLAAEQVEGLFKRFGAGARSKGVGLGLALVQTTAIRHGGAVACFSEPGQGARFELSLPLDA